MGQVGQKTLMLVLDTLGGGLGAAALRQADHFEDRGWNVLILARHASNRLDLDKRLIDLSAPDRVADLTGMMVAASELRRLIHRHSPDVIHAHGSRSAMICLLAGRRPVVTDHGGSSLLSESVMLRRLRPFVFYMLAHLAKEAITVAPRRPRAWRFIPLQSPRLSSLELEPFRHPSPRPTFLWISRLSEQKRPDLFVRALSWAASKTEVSGIMAGTGQLEPRLRALAGELSAPVRFVGHVDDVAELIREAWSVVNLSHFEGFPFAVQEAMWVGRPVILSPLPYADYLRGPGVFVADTVEDVGQAILHLSDRQTAEDAGAAVAERIRRLLGDRDHWQEIETLYDRLTERN